MSDGDNPAQTPRRDRGPGGRFAAGNALGPANGRQGGRPPRAVEEGYLEALREAVPLAAWKKAVKAVLSRAIEAGDARALDLLGRYLLPSPETRAKLTLERPREERSVEELVRDAKRMIKEIEAEANEESPARPVLARGQREPEPLPRPEPEPSTPPPVRTLAALPDGGRVPAPKWTPPPSPRVLRLGGDHGDLDRENGSKIDAPGWPNGWPAPLRPPKRCEPDKPN